MCEGMIGEGGRGELGLTEKEMGGCRNKVREKDK